MQPAGPTRGREPVEGVRGELGLRYRYSYGPMYDRFFRETRDSRTILGAKCSRCGAVLLPPRAYCGFCFVDPEGWMRVSDTGTVMSFTVVSMEYPGQALDPPYVYALIMLDGADVPFPHLLGEVSPEQVAAGMRVRAAWAEDRKGTLKDIQYFRPA